MITINNPIIIPEQTYNGIWIKSLYIQAPNPNQPVTATIVLAPYDGTGSIAPTTRIARVDDVMSLADTNDNVANVMTNLYAYVQDQITSGSISFS